MPSTLLKGRLSRSVIVHPCPLPTVQTLHRRSLARRHTICRLMFSTNVYMSLGRVTAAEGHAALAAAVTGAGAAAGVTAAEAAAADALEPEGLGGIFTDRLWNSFFLYHITIHTISHGMRISLQSSLGQLQSKGTLEEACTPDRLETLYFVLAYRLILVTVPLLLFLCNGPNPHRSLCSYSNYHPSF